MSDYSLSPLDPVQLALERTPARVLVGRAGPGYHTATWLKLREDHAAARHALRMEVDLQATFGMDRIMKHGLFDAQSRAGSKTEYLLRPDLGRVLNDQSHQLVAANCPTGCDLQVVIGDGLSETAVALQAPGLLDRLHATVLARGRSFGRPFLVRYCRVGVMNEIGDLLAPSVIVLLIGERPGLATAESLSAYMAFRPRTGHTDADRNLISNIHSRGIHLDNAAQRILALADQMQARQLSGVEVKEVLNPDTSLPSSPTSFGGSGAE
jgi:ethanolamine ammonia-lyase small subunit